MLQGLTLGPLLFVLINSVHKKLFTLIFADDTSTFIEGDNLPELIQILNDELNKLYDWQCID